MWAILPHLLIGLVFISLAHDEDNIWKVLACAVCLTLAVSFLRFDSRTDGYVDGYKDSTCHIYERLDERKHTADLDEYCGD